MSGVQKQELFVFSDHSVLPSGSPHLILLTSTASTSPSWLINALVEASVTGSPSSINPSSIKSPNDYQQRRPAVICSFLHNAKHFDTALSRLKLKPHTFTILDFMTDFVLQNTGKPKETLLSSLLDRFPKDPLSMVVLEQPELLLGLIDDLTSDELHSGFITPLLKQSGLVIIASPTDYYSNTEDLLDADTVQFNRYLLSCAYKAIAVLSIKPLETGKSKDASGSLTISKGGAHMTYQTASVIENEYLFLTQKDTTRLFYR